MIILVFLQGTLLMHRGGINRTRSERVRQVIQDEESVHDFAAYVPVGEAVKKLNTWQGQGAQIAYLSSHQNAEDVEKDKAILQRNGFPEGRLLHRQGGQNYGQIAESILPDILIEDDCESIGGGQEITYLQIRPEARLKIKSIIVKEFGGIDHLPDEVHSLAGY
jgi:hypothetical protein